MEELLRVFGIDHSSSGGSRNNEREYLTSVAPSGGVAVVGASRLLVLVVLVLVLVLVMDMWTVDGSTQVFKGTLCRALSVSLCTKKTLQASVDGCGRFSSLRFSVLCSSLLGQNP